MDEEEEEEDEEEAGPADRKDDTSAAAPRRRLDRLLCGRLVLIVPLSSFDNFPYQSMIMEMQNDPDTERRAGGGKWRTRRGKGRSGTGKGIVPVRVAIPRVALIEFAQ